MPGACLSSEPGGAEPLRSLTRCSVRLWRSLAVAVARGRAQGFTRGGKDIATAAGVPGCGRCWRLPSSAWHRRRARWKRHRATCWCCSPTAAWRRAMPRSIEACARCSPTPRRRCTRSTSSSTLPSSAGRRTTARCSTTWAPSTPTGRPQHCWFLPTLPTNSPRAIGSRASRRRRWSTARCPRPCSAAGPRHQGRSASKSNTTSAARSYRRCAGTPTRSG